MMGRAGRRMAAVGAAVMAVAVAATGCGVVKLVPPPGTQEANGHEPVAADNWLSSCAVLTKPEVETALGGPVEEPELYLGAHTSANKHGNSCIWPQGRHGRVSTFVAGAGHGPEHDAHGGGSRKKLPDIGRSTFLAYDGRHTVEVSGHSKTGHGFFVVLSKAGANRDDLEQKTIELARIVADRIVASLPGDPTAVAAPPPPPKNPCDLVPYAERVGITGWVAGRDDGPAAHYEPFVGGWLGGGASCTLTSGNFRASLAVLWSSNPVPLEAARARGVPLGDALPHPSFYAPRIEEQRAPGSGYTMQSELAIVMPDGRALVIKLRGKDGTEEEHRRKSVELARLALRSMPPQ